MQKGLGRFGCTVSEQTERILATSCCKTQIKKCPNALDIHIFIKITRPSISLNTHCPCWLVYITSQVRKSGVLMTLHLGSMHTAATWTAATPYSIHSDRHGTYSIKTNKSHMILIQAEWTMHYIYNHKPHIDALGLYQF